MAITNQERIGKAMDLLKEGLQPFVEREMKAQHAQRWFEEARNSVSDTQVHLFGTEDRPKWDVASTLSVMWSQWNLVFKSSRTTASKRSNAEAPPPLYGWTQEKFFASFVLPDPL